MKKIVTSLILISSVTMVYAWENHSDHAGRAHHPEKHHHHSARPHLERELHLTREQQDAIVKIRDQYKPKESKLHEHDFIRSLDPTKADYQAKIEEQAVKVADQAKDNFLRHSKIHAETYRVLNEEQREILKQTTHCEIENKKGNK